jgi:hypothetical protein
VVSPVIVTHNAAFRAVRSSSILAGFLLVSMISGTSLQAADSTAITVQKKLDMIHSGRAKPGSVFRFTAAELNAWVRMKAPMIVPAGFRQPRLVLGDGEANASALIDFLKVRDASGVATNWLVAKLIQGEKLVTARASIRSAHGHATVHLLRVEIGGLAVTGAPLDFLVENFFRPFYPDAKIDQPFELAGNVDRIEVTQAEARVYIRQ